MGRNFCRQGRITADFAPTMAKSPDHCGRDQRVTANFMDATLPRADDVGMQHFSAKPVPFSEIRFGRQGLCAVQAIGAMKIGRICRALNGC